MFPVRLKFTRLDAYKAMAESLIGEGASLGTLYDLTPYSWLANWYVDVGGILHYQQAIANNQVAAVSNGYSLMELLSVRASLQTPTLLASDTYVIDTLSQSPGYAVATYGWKRHTRRGGTPYSMSPTWSMSPQQWAITGALGLSRSTGVPIKRV